MGQPKRKDDDHEEFVLVRQEDFQSIEIHVSIENLATKTKPDGKVEILEFLDQGLLLEAPGNTGSDGHNLMMRIETKNAKEDIDMRATVKVTSLEKTPDGKVKIAVKMIQFEESEWEKLIGIYQARQAEIINYIEAVKGY